MIGLTGNSAAVPFAPGQLGPHARSSDISNQPAPMRPLPCLNQSDQFGKNLNLLLANDPARIMELGSMRAT